MRLPLPEFVRTTTFRWAVGASAAFALCTLLMFGFVLFATIRFTTQNIDTLVTGAMERIERASTRDAVIQAVEDHLQEDTRGVRLAALFAADGKRIAGNIRALSSDLTVDAAPQYVRLTRLEARGSEHAIFRAIGHRLSNGDTVVVGRDVSEVVQFERIVRETLTLGLIPALALSIATGILLSVRAQRRVRLVNGRVQRIMAGDLRERLPTQGSNDPFDKLASGVNTMLDEIETLVKSIASVGNDIAHDLRTPLTRVRICLERGRDNAKTPEELREVVNQAIVRLDQSLAVITALLRISEIEHTRRFDAFRQVALADLLQEVHELYEPISEDKNVVMSLEAKDNLYTYGDRDLLFEAVANLVDNAVKFTPEGGRVTLSLSRRDRDAVIRVADSGPGIPDGDTELVKRRFYRSDKSRTEPGFGLGLSLVNAIVKLHGFRMKLSSGPGCIAEVSAPLQPT